jgi:hypothetical protein
VSDLVPGPFRFDIIETTGIRVSTIIRESSARDWMSPYFKTLAFRLVPAAHGSAILWQSSATREWMANRQHDTAVRWFSRDWR